MAEPPSSSRGGGSAAPASRPVCHLTSRQAAACAIACAGAGALAALMAMRFAPARTAKLLHAHRHSRSRSASASSLSAAATAAASAAAPLRSEVVVLGSGSSTGVPRATCVTDPNSTCETCKLAMQGGRSSNRNWRGNPSLLIRFVRPASESGSEPETGSRSDATADADANAAPLVVSHIQIDVCKTFLATALRIFPRLGVRRLDSALITHEHADAVLGMDDLRSMQSGNVNDRPARMPVHVSQHTLRSMKLKFPYLVDGGEEADVTAATAATAAAAGTPAITAASSSVPVMSADSAAAIAADNVSHASSCVPSSPSPAPAPAAVVPVCRHVAMLSWSVVRPFVPFRTCGLDVLPLPVIHGEDYVSLSYLFGTGLGQPTEAGKEACLYISDVSRIPQVTWDYLCTGVLPTPPPAVADDPRAVAEWFERFNLPQSHPLPADQPQWSHMPSTPKAPAHRSDEGTAAAAGASSSSASPSPSPPRISLLIVDALFPLYTHNTHFNLSQSLSFIERLRPDRALITGMSDLFEYGRDNAELQRRRAAGELSVDVQLAYDGMRVPINL